MRPSIWSKDSPMHLFQAFGLHLLICNCNLTTLVRSGSLNRLITHFHTRKLFLLRSPKRSPITTDHHGTTDEPSDRNPASSCCLHTLKRRQRLATKTHAQLCCSLERLQGHCTCVHRPMTRGVGTKEKHMGRQEVWTPPALEDQY